MAAIAVPGIKRTRNPYPTNPFSIHPYPDPDIFVIVRETTEGEQDAHTHKKSKRIHYHQWEYQGNHSQRISWLG